MRSPGGTAVALRRRCCAEIAGHLWAGASSIQSDDLGDDAAIVHCPATSGIAAAWSAKLSGLIDTGAMHCPAGIRQMMTRGIAVSRLKAAAVMVAATIRVTLRIEIRNLHPPAAGDAGSIWRVRSCRRDDMLEVNAEIF